MKSRLILNGKSAANPIIREAVQKLRRQDKFLEVRVTWEDGDAIRFTREACADGIDRVVAGGGDGTVNEVVNGLMACEKDSRAVLGILPLGTANDFATGCNIPQTPYEALELATSEGPVPVDVARVNDKFFINVASGGFGAEVTTSTPPELKRLLGGGAYSLMGVIMALNFKAYSGRLQLPGKEQELTALVGAVGNGRLAGGGKVVAPQAYIDDGLLDVLVIRRFQIADLGQVAQEISNLTADGRFVSYHQTPWVEFSNSEPVPVNLDGEPNTFETGKVEVVSGAVGLIVRPDCPLLSENRPKNNTP